MLFNSIEFAIFLPIVFILHWFVFSRTQHSRNLLLTAASFLFYGWWDWRFLLLMVGTATVDYFLAQVIGSSANPRVRKWVLAGSLISNLGVLFFFKYFDFFVQSFAESFTFFGGHLTATSLNIVLPVGISFYTFQALSYTIDVYRGNLKATKDYLAYLTFISFFPQLVAGPIERATNLLPQFTRLPKFDYDVAVNGTRLILWGLFKKIVVADNCAIAVDVIFGRYTELSSSTLALGAMLFAFQIYCDFSGYSDVAIGTAKLFGIDLMTNFSLPYFSRNIPEFWRRWHISLSTWFKDYVYIPLGGNRGTLRIRIRNILVVFLVSGIWHGANWTFVVWGLLNAVYFIGYGLIIRGTADARIVAHDHVFPSVKELLQIGSTFLLTTVAWVFFRSETVTDAFRYLRRMVSPSLFSMPQPFPVKSLMAVGILLLIEWIQRRKAHGLDFEWTRVPAVARWTVYLVICIIVILNMGEPQKFIYFQF